MDAINGLPKVLNFLKGYYLVGLDFASKMKNNF
jgi:hypothetical protein